MTEENELRCPFLGLADDEDTSISYPSEWNVCHKCHGKPSPIYAVQSELCLSSEHNNCDLYKSNGTAWMPMEMKNSEGAAKPADPNQKRRLIISAILIGLITFIGMIFTSYSNEINSVVNVFTQPTSTVTLVPTFTNTPILETPTLEMISPTITPYPTLTKFVFSKCGHALDEEFGTDKKYIIHQIKDGESIDKVLEPFLVTYEQILAVNYFVPKPLWVGFPVIIPISDNDVGSRKTYQAVELNETNLTIDVLSSQLGIEPTLFANLNSLEEGCNSFSGWFIVPRDKVKYYE